MNNLLIIALSPTASKLTTQYLVLDHMNNHYSKITKARRKYEASFSYISIETYYVVGTQKNHLNETIF